MPSIFNFITKEGKHFAPIVGEVPSSYRPATPAEISDTTITKYVGDDGNQYVGVGSTEKAGNKGTFSVIRMTLPTGPEIPGSMSPETLTFSGSDISPCWVEYVAATWTRVPDAEASLLQFTPVGYWRGSVRNRPTVITPEAGVPVWTANVRGVDNYIFYIETDLETTDGFALGQPGLSIAHSATGFRSRDITERILWTPSCDLIGRNALIGTRTPGTMTNPSLSAGRAQEQGELFAVNTEFFNSSY